VTGLNPSKPFYTKPPEKENLQNGRQRGIRVDLPANTGRCQTTNGGFPRSDENSRADAG
jgi:hypothetical protein